MVVNSLIHEEIEKEVTRLRYTLEDVKETKDEKIKIVLAHSESKKEYVTWGYNTQSRGLLHGRYFNYGNNDDCAFVREQALKDFKERR